MFYTKYIFDFTGYELRYTNNPDNTNNPDKQFVLFYTKDAAVNDVNVRLILQKKTWKMPSLSRGKEFTSNPVSNDPPEYNYSDNSYNGHLGGRRKTRRVKSRKQKRRVRKSRRNRRR